MSIFKESESYRPFTYPWAADAAKRHSIDMFWDVHQVEMQDDLRQWMSVDGLKTKNVSHETTAYMVEQIVCLFTELDRSVASGYTKLLTYVKNNEIRNLWLTFAAREVVHQRAYALAAETFGFSDSSWTVFNSYKEMRNKVDVMVDDLTNSDYRDELNACITLAQVLLGEGIGLFAAFSYLLNLKRFALLIGFNDVNQWSLVDEQDHVTNNIRVLKEARKDLTEVENIVLDDIILKLVEDYIAAEHLFIDLITAKGEAEDFTKEEAKEYISYLGELRLFSMGMVGMSEVRKNPLPWMEWLVAGSRHDNFFEKRVTDYSHSKLEGGLDLTRYYSMLPIEKRK